MWMFYAFLALLLLPAAVVIALYASRIRFSRRIVAQTVPAQSSPQAWSNSMLQRPRQGSPLRSIGVMVTR